MGEMSMVKLAAGISRQTICQGAQAICIKIFKLILLSFLHTARHIDTKYIWKGDTYSYTFRRNNFFLASGDIPLQLLVLLGGSCQYILWQNFSARKKKYVLRGLVLALCYRRNISNFSEILPQTCSGVNLFRNCHYYKGKMFNNWLILILFLPWKVGGIFVKVIPSLKSRGCIPPPPPPPIYQWPWRYSSFQGHQNLISTYQVTSIANF